MATGDEIAIEVRWKTRRARSSNGLRGTWIRDIKTKKPPANNWVFAGSRFVEDGEGRNHFLGDSGDFVCVLNNPIAMLDLPVVSARRDRRPLFRGQPQTPCRRPRRR